MKQDSPNARLTARKDWCEGLATFTVEPDGWVLPEFLPGQFTNLALPIETWGAHEGKVIKRAYSIASPSGQKGMEFFIRLVDEGELTPRIWNMKIGDGIFLDDRIAGHFTLEGAQDAEDLVLVGTGTGVAPYRPMIMDPAQRNRFERIVLMYSDRTKEDLGYIEEFEQFAREDERFLFLPTVTREPDDSTWAGLRGRVTTHLEPENYQRITGKPMTPERCQVFLCGNPEMITQVQELLEGHGFAKHRKKVPGQLHLEKYW